MRRDWAALQHALDAALGRDTTYEDANPPPPEQPRPHRRLPVNSPVARCDHCGTDTKGTWAYVPERHDGKLCLQCLIRMLK